MDISPGLLAVLGTLVGVAIGSGSTLVATLISKRSEERKHLRELVMNAAIVQWKTAIEVGKASGMGGKIDPLSLYIVHMLKISDLISSGKIDQSSVTAVLKEADEVFEEGRKYVLDKERSKTSK